MCVYKTGVYQKELIEAFGKKEKKNNSKKIVLLIKRPFFFPKSKKIGYNTINAARLALRLMDQRKRI